MPQNRIKFFLSMKDYLEKNVRCTKIWKICTKKKTVLKNYSPLMIESRDFSLTRQFAYTLHHRCTWQINLRNLYARRPFYYFAPSIQIRFTICLSECWIVLVYSVHCLCYFKSLGEGETQKTIIHSANLRAAMHIK